MLFHSTKLWSNKKPDSTNFAYACISERNRASSLNYIKQYNIIQHGNIPAVPAYLIRNMATEKWEDIQTPITVWAQKPYITLMYNQARELTPSYLYLPENNDG